MVIEGNWRKWIFPPPYGIYNYSGACQNKKNETDKPYLRRKMKGIGSYCRQQKTCFSGQKAGKQVN
jgi:hypothetical protein